FLTDLSAYDIVLGKLSATSVNILYGLLALIPVMALPTLLGGVTLADVCRLALVLLNSLFFALSLAMFVSAVSWQEKKAIGMTILLLFAVGGALPRAGVVTAGLSGSRATAAMLSVLSPAYACALVPDTAYRAAPRLFWLSTAWTQGLGWLFF